MIRRLTAVLFLLAAATALAQPVAPAANPGPADGPVLHGRIDGNYYVSPGMIYRIEIPVSPKLGGQISDTDEVVTFIDDFNVHLSIACFPQDATQRWELATRGTKDYCVYFFSNYILPDFQQMFPGASVESARYAPDLMDGALLIYTLLPGGSMFADKAAVLPNAAKAPVAKRGNLVFVYLGHIYVLSSELAERVTEGSKYHKTTAEEDEILRQRLTDIAGKIGFNTPAEAKPAKGTAPAGRK